MASSCEDTPTSSSSWVWHWVWSQQEKRKQSSQKVTVASWSVSASFSSVFSHSCPPWEGQRKVEGEGYEHSQRTPQNASLEPRIVQKKKSSSRSLISMCKGCGQCYH